MGCDIHIVAELFNDETGKWELVGNVGTSDGWRDMPEVYEGRNYNLFALLADVRNRHDVKPISVPRGVPLDACDDVRAWVDQWDSNGHSHSWLTVAEFDAFDWSQIVNESGYVTLEVYRSWKSAGASSAPEWWCGGVGGGSVRVLSKEDADAIEVPSEELAATSASTHDYVHISWTRAYADFAREWIDDTMPKLRNMGPPGKVRVVFFFDN